MMEPGSVKKIPYITKHQICRTPFDAYTFWAHHKCIRLLSQALYGRSTPGCFFSFGTPLFVQVKS